MLSGKTSAGVENVYQGNHHCQRNEVHTKLIKTIDFLNIHPQNWTSDAKLNELKRLIHNFTIEHNKEIGRLGREKFNVTVGDELPAGVLKLAKVYVVKKRKLKVGDKMAGRHGNKGIVAKIVREEDMPFLEDGSPVDIVLNPLGVPSRMNIGQIYETVLGWAGEKLGKKYATPIFDGASIAQIDEEMNKAGLPRLGQTYLYDGETGERFHQKTTVGVICMLKLSHMIDDKIHVLSGLTVLSRSNLSEVRLSLVVSV